jgi:hypothetical protein
MGKTGHASVFGWLRGLEATLPPVSPSRSPSSLLPALLRLSFPLSFVSPSRSPSRELREAEFGKVAIDPFGKGVYAWLTALPAVAAAAAQPTGLQQSTDLLVHQPASRLTL